VGEQNVFQFFELQVEIEYSFLQGHPESVFESWKLKVVMEIVGGASEQAVD